MASERPLPVTAPRRRRAWLSAAVFVVIGLASVAAWRGVDQSEQASADALSRQRLEVAGNLVEQGIRIRTDALRRLAERQAVASDEAARATLFAIDAGIYLRDFHSITHLGWVEPGGTVHQVLPEPAGGMLAEGQRLADDPVRAGLLRRAAGDGQPLASPPVSLPGGGHGEWVVVRSGSGGVLRGYVVAVIDHERLFQPMLGNVSAGFPLRVRAGEHVLYQRGRPVGPPDATGAVAPAGQAMVLEVWESPSQPWTHLLDEVLLVSALLGGGLLALALWLSGQARERALEARAAAAALAGQVEESERARAALREAERELGEVFDSISDAFYTLDPEWRFALVNTRAEQLMHRKREDLVGRSVWEAFPEAAGTIIEQNYREAVASRQPVEFEVYFPPLSAWFEVRAFPNPHGLAVYFQDISDRKRTELGLLKAKLTSERAQRLAQLGSWEYDLATGERSWSEEVMRIFGLGPERVGRGLPALLERVHFEDRARLQEAWRSLHAGEGDIDIEYRVQRPDGDTRVVREMGTLIRDEHGQPTLSAGALQDITERRQAEDALRELTRRLEQSLVMNRLVMENSLDVICAMDANGRFAQVSSACLAVWGHAPNELVGRPYLDLLHPDDRGRALRIGAAVMAGHPTLDFRNRFIRKDGSVIAMQWSLVWSARERLMFAVGRDVSEAERQSKALLEARDSLQRAQAVARMGSWELDIAANQLTWSDEVYRIFRVERDEFAGTFEAFAARVHPEDLPALQAAQARALAGEAELDIQHRILLPGGGIGHVHERGRLLRNDQGVAWLLSGSVQDITERVRAEAELAREREFLRAMLESLSEGIVACDAEGRLTLFNRATREIHGLPLEEVPAGRWASHYGMFDADGQTPLPDERVPLRRALAGEYVRDVEVVVKPEGKPPRVVRVSGERIASASGQPMGAVIAMHDITEAKRTERMEAGQRVILEGIAARRPLDESLEAITRLYEQQYPGAMCSVLLLDESGEHVLTAAAPSLPRSYSLAIHGAPIGEGAGSCGTAAARGSRVVVTDIASDPLWKDYAALALGHGLRACWSTPVKSAEGRVLATFATYYGEVRAPSPQELSVIDTMAAIAAMAIEQDAAYRRLSLSEQRFRSLFEEHPDAVFSLDPAGRFTTFNGHFQALAGGSPEQVLGQSFEERVAPEQRDMVHAHFAAALRGEARTFELTALTLQGQRIEVRLTHLPIMVDGRVTGVFGIAQDISLLRKHQRDLAQALDAAEGTSLQLRRLSDAAIVVNRDLDEKNLYQRLVELLRGILGAHQAVVSVDAGAGTRQLINAVSLSDKYAQWRDYDVPIDGSGIYMMVAERQAPMRLSQAELEAHPRWRGFGAESSRHPPMRGWLAVPLVASDGSHLGVLQLSDKVRGEFTADDELVAVQFAQLATIAIERARLIAKLSVRDRFFEMSLEVFVIFDPAQQRFVQVNPVLCDITGYTREELCRRDFKEFLHPDDWSASDDRARRLAQGREVINSFVNRYVCKDGSLRWMEWMSSPAPDGLVYAVGRDVTERRKAEVALRQTLADLASRNRELQDFAFIASHDLQEPLRKIRAFSDRLQRKHAAALDAEARDYLERSGQAAARMQVLIDDLLAYSRVAARGKAFGPVDLGTVLAAVLEDLEARLESSGGQVESGPLPTLVGDATQFRQLLQNLLANALKFRAPGRPPRVRVSAAAARLEGQPAWEIRVEDNGIGFETRHAERIFGPFQRLHGRQDYEGTGIGLAIVRRIVERHGGTIRAEGRPGEGAAFILLLPEIPPDPAAVPVLAVTPGG